MTPSPKKTPRKSPRLSKWGNRGGNFCCVPGCANTSQQTKALGSGVRYFSFPKDKARRERWIVAIKRLDKRGRLFKPTPAHFVCSSHFVGGRHSKDPNSESYGPTLFTFKTPNENRRGTAAASRAMETPNLKEHRKKFQPKELALLFDCAGTFPRGRPGKDKPVSTEQPPEHDYIRTTCDQNMHEEEHVAVMCELVELRERVEKLEKKVLSLESISHSSDLIQFYTGFINTAMLMACFKFFNAKSHALRMWYGQAAHSSVKNSTSRPGSDRKLSNLEAFFMTLVRLKTGAMVKDLAMRFQVSEGTISQTFATWVNFMATELTTYLQLPDLPQLRQNRSQSFQNYPDVNMIIDCTEVFSEAPSDLVEKKHTFSNYKHHQTFKFLVGISAHPAVIYVSRMYGGRASDMQITSESTDMITAMQATNSRVMADRGFTGTYKMTPVGIEFVTPAFKGTGRDQMTPGEVASSARCSNARIHVERVIQRIKSYHILDGPMRNSMKHLGEQIFKTCAYLTNFQNPVLTK